MKYQVNIKQFKYYTNQATSYLKRELYCRSSLLVRISLGTQNFVNYFIRYTILSRDVMKMFVRQEYTELSEKYFVTIKWNWNSSNWLISKELFLFLIKHCVIKTESASIVLHVLNLDTRCRKMLCFTLRQLSSPRYLLERDWVGPKTDLKIWDKGMSFPELMV